MAFESLSYRYSFTINNFPERWLPLIHLYDADLPLFPIYYFHSLNPNIQANSRPTYQDRVFGYVEKINLVSNNSVEIFVITNKDLSNIANASYIPVVQDEILERFGLINPVTITDVTNAFQNPYQKANAILLEMWHRVVASAYDNLLPFGKLWDEVLGLTRFVASWNSPGGRKGELIQTHYFCSKFGERIQSGGNIHTVDFYLLPTISELLDINNPLNLFPEYQKLVEVSNIFQHNNSSLINVGNVIISKFNNIQKGRFNTAKILNLINSSHIPSRLRNTAIECFNTFDKGPQRTVIFFLMLSDIRNGRLNISSINNQALGSMYDGALDNTYQSPKVIHIYAQQCFAHTSAIPIDEWIRTFFQWPLNIYSLMPSKNKHQHFFNHSTGLGKVERLIWVTAQARKVHSSACNDALWCIKYASKGVRGANPLACKICLNSIRNACSAYSDIKTLTVSFNQSRQQGAFN